MKPSKQVAELYRRFQELAQYYDPRIKLVLKADGSGKVTNLYNGLGQKLEPIYFADINQGMYEIWGQVNVVRTEQALYDAEDK